MCDLVIICEKSKMEARKVDYIISKYICNLIRHPLNLCQPAFERLVFVLLAAKLQKCFYFPFAGNKAASTARQLSFKLSVLMRLCSFQFSHPLDDSHHLVFHISIFILPRAWLYHLSHPLMAGLIFIAGFLFLCPPWTL